MPLAFKEELLLGAFVYFAEAGTTIDSAVVSISSLPDEVPTTNWTDRALGNIERVKITRQVKEIPQAIAKASGGYDETPKRIGTGWTIEMTTSEYLELIHRLQLGAPATVVDGTSFTPFQVGGDSKITGWVKIVAKDEDGNDKIVIKEWVDLRLTDIPEWSNAYGKPVLQFTVLGDNGGGLSECTVNA